MNTQIGKSIGIALLLVAGLLAALFATGVFSATGVGAHPDDADKPTHSTLAMLLVTAKDSDDKDATVQDGNITISQIQHGYALEVPADAATVTVVATGGSDSTVSYTPTGGADIDVTESYETKIEILVSGHKSGDVILPDQTFTLTVRPKDGLATPKTTPGSNQSLVVQHGSGFARDEDIIVKLVDFGVPSTIGTNDVRVAFTSKDTGKEKNGNPSDIETDGTTVTLVAPFIDSNGEDIPDKLINTGANITFRRGAGITLPIRHGDYAIKVTNDDDADDGVQNWVTVRREVSVSPSSGNRGTEITVSGKGFADGSADLYIASASPGLVQSVNVFRTSDPINVSDGTFSFPVDTAEKVEGKNVFSGTGERETFIQVSDSRGKPAVKSAKFTITPSFSVSPDSPLAGANITVTLNDVDPMMTGTGDQATAVAPKVAFAGGNAIDAKDDGDSGSNKDRTWQVKVPAGVRIGTIEIKVTNIRYDKPLTQNITIGTNDLTVNPTTVVPRQEISIDGSGFTSADDLGTTTEKENTVAANSVTVGGKKVDHGEQLVNNNGNISFNVRVPDDVVSGTREVKVSDVAGRVGVATITVAKAEVTLEPAESLIGSEVTVSGTGFPANDLVLISYDDNTVDTAPTDSTGTFEQTITVPSSSDITPGGSYDVEAKAQVNDVKTNAETKHSLPDPVITLSPSSTSAGEAITVNGQNFKGFLQVYRIEIGGQNVTPVPAPATDRWGAFSAGNLRVPQLNQGRYAVKVIIEDSLGDSATEFLQVVTATVEVETDPAKVFAELSDRLVRVWYLDSATQTWSFYDPDPEVAAFNSLNEVNSGQIVTVIISAGDPVEFQGTNLYAGTNNKSLD